MEAAPLFQQIVELVKEAHSRGIALRDIKLKKLRMNQGEDWTQILSPFGSSLNNANFAFAN